MLEHDAFAALGFEVIEHAPLFLRQMRSLGEVDARMREGAEQVREDEQPLRVAPSAQILIADEQDVECAEHVANRFTIEGEVFRACLCIALQRFGQCHSQAATVDARDLAILFVQEEAATVPFFLHPICGVLDEFLRVVFLDGIEQLAVDAGGLIFLLRLPIRCAVRAGRVALRGLFLHELFVNRLRLRVGDRRLRFGSRAQRAAAPAIREVDGEAAAFRLDGCLIDFVRRALPEIEGDVFHFRFLLSCGCRVSRRVGVQRERTAQSDGAGVLPQIS